MKCDELKRFNIVGKYRDEETMHEFRPDGVCYDADDVDAAIAELKAKLEDVQATAYAESVDVGMENRKLKRALWLARAAMCRTYDIRAYFIENPDSKRRFTDFFVLMQKAAATAAIKAEEYK